MSVDYAYEVRKDWWGRDYEEGHVSRRWRYVHSKVHQFREVTNLLTQVGKTSATTYSIVKPGCRTTNRQQKRKWVSSAFWRIPSTWSPHSLKNPRLFVQSPISTTTDSYAVFFVISRLCSQSLSQICNPRTHFTFCVPFYLRLTTLTSHAYT